MSLKPGTRLGPYEILSLLGSGGMGDVYKAHDTRLDRIVALKTLRAHLAADQPEVKERFEREARTVASLQHEHICVVYDIRKDAPVLPPVSQSSAAQAATRQSSAPQDPIDYLVLEYLEGETLATRLLKGPLPLAQVLQYSVEIADALDKAHRKEITHRDIKPGNIMLVKSGSGYSTKLLDFGLAKLKQAAPAEIPLGPDDPTPPRGMQPPGRPQSPTVVGTILGTFQYMAPEQAEGKNDEIDARTDIFSFGAVIYEMVTGKKAFEGKTQASLIAKILETEPPPISAVEPMTPPALERVVKTCLAKEPDERWQTARDLCRELKWIRDGGGQAAPAPQPVVTLPPPEPPPPPPTWRRMLPWALIVVAVAIAIIATWMLKPTPAAMPPQVSRFTITLPAGDKLAAGNNPALAISSDCSRLVYAAIHGGAQQLYVRDIGALEAKPLAGTEGGTSPFFSPDSQWIGFFAAGNLKKVSVNGGAPVTLCPVRSAEPFSAAWGTDGTIVFHVANIGGIWRVADSGGTPKQATTPASNKGEVAHRWPQVLPGGKAMLFVASANSSNWAGAQVTTAMLESGERRDLGFGGSRPAFAPSGYLVYAQGGTLMATPFDPKRLELRGAAVPIQDGVSQSLSSGVAQYSFSNNGSLIYVPGGMQGAQRTLAWVDRKGAEQPLKAAAHAYRYPRISPDGRRVAVTIEEQGSQIWIYDLIRETLTRLTFQGTINLLGAWTPDGKRIAFGSNSGEAAQNLFWQPADGSGGSERLATSEYIQTPNSFSPDGQLLAWAETNPTTVRDIWVMRLSDRKSQAFLKTPGEESAPRFSPDGRWLAYSSDESGRREVYVQPYPGPGGKWQISTDGGQEPVWNSNGRELFYRIGSKIMAVEIASQQGFSAGTPRMLLEGPYIPTSASLPNYDVSPDGQRLLMVKPTEQEAAPTQINVVLNWFEELKKKVPVK